MDVNLNATLQRMVRELTIEKLKISRDYSNICDENKRLEKELELSYCRIDELESILQGLKPMISEYEEWILEQSQTDIIEYKNSFENGI